MPIEDSVLPFPGFAPNLIGHSETESLEFEITIPEDYARKEYAGKQCAFEVEILSVKEKNSVSKESLAYVNRLSDLCFVAARYANQTERGGQGDVLWRPGKTKME